MRFDEAFLSNFSPAFHQSWQSADRARAFETARADRAAELEAARAERAATRETEQRLQAEADRWRRRQAADHLALQDAAEQRRAATEQAQLRMEQTKLDEAVRTKRVKDYTERFAGLDPAAMHLERGALEKKQAAGQALSPDDHAALEASDRVLAQWRTRAPETEKVTAYDYPRDKDGKVLYDADGKPLMTEKREFTRRLPSAGAAAPAFTFGEDRPVKKADGTTDWDALKFNQDRAREKAYQDVVYGGASSAAGPVPATAAPGPVARVSLMDRVGLEAAAKRKAAEEAAAASRKQAMMQSLVDYPTYNG